MPNRNNTAYGGMDGNFNKTYRDASLALASHPAYPLWIRIGYAAEARVDRYGHASFRRGELREVLATYDERTGEVKVPSKQSVTAAISKAREVGAILPESNAECIVLDRSRVAYHNLQPIDRSLHRCPKHGKGDLMS